MEDRKGHVTIGYTLFANFLTLSCWSAAWSNYSNGSEYGLNTGWRTVAATFTAGTHSLPIAGDVKEKEDPNRTIHNHALEFNGESY